MGISIKGFIYTAACLAACSIPLRVEAHSGGTNASGCHNNHSTGDYHCHNSGSNSGSSNSPNYDYDYRSPSRAPSNSPNDIQTEPGNVIILPSNRGNTVTPAPTSSSPPSTINSSIGQTLWEVVSVGDGDTIRVRQANENLTVRLACIDAPEIAQAPYGDLARDRLRELLPTNTIVSLRPIDTDRYGRIVAEVFRQDMNLNLALVQGGYAVAYRQYLSNCDATQYLDFESRAQQYGWIFWSQANPVMPWDFRRQ